MRTLLWCVVLVVLGAGGVASAQPGADPAAPQPTPPPYAPPAPQPYAPQPYPPQPQAYPPPPYAYQPQVVLTADDQALLADGEISDAQHIGGGVASLFVGFGLGQALQGRWSDTGWIFTLGEAASFTALIYGISQQDCFFGGCDHGDFGGDDDGDGFIVAGLVGFVVFHVWEVVDAFVGPVRHNRRVRDLRLRLGYPAPMYGKRMTPYLVPPHDGAGAVAGVSLHF